MVDTAGALAALIRDAEAFRDQRVSDYRRAVEYHDGKMTDTPAADGFSQAVSRDLRAMEKKVLPSVLRTILGNEQVVEYQPTSAGKEAAAEQATDYVNGVVLAESDAHRAIETAARDAARKRNGVLRWYYDQRREAVYSTHSGLDEMAVAVLVQDGAEIIAKDIADDGSYTVQLKRLRPRGRVVLAAVAPEEFLIHPEAMTIDDSPIVGIATAYRRSDLVAMGYERSKIYALHAAGQRQDAGYRQDRTEPGSARDAALELEEVAYYELYVRLDSDGDGIAELRRVVLAGGTGEDNILDNEPWDEVPFADVVFEHRPHAWEGVSLADDMMELQRIKTVLMRQTLDNLYWQNMPQIAAQEGAIVNPEAVTSPQFGLPIRIRQGMNVNDAVQFLRVPFVASESFGMLDYIDKAAKDRTGITEATAGLSPDALQNVTARASALMENQGVAQIDAMVRSFCAGLKRAFRGLLKLTIQHQDKPRTVRLRGEWKAFDPRSWDADMDCTVNTGLGAGTRERDMAAMMQVIGLQEKLLGSMGADNPFVKPDNVFNAIARLVQAAGLRDVTPYFTKPDRQEVAARLEAMRNKPTPEQEKAQTFLEIERMKVAAAAQKEQAQAEADMIVRQHASALEAQQAAEAHRIKRYEIDLKAQIERERLEIARARLLQQAMRGPQTEPAHG